MDDDVYKIVDVSNADELTNLNSDEELELTDEEIIEGNQKITDTFNSIQKIADQMPPEFFFGNQGKHKNKYTKKKTKNLKKSRKLQRQNRKKNRKKKK